MHLLVSTCHKDKLHLMTVCGIQHCTTTDEWAQNNIFVRGRPHSVRQDVGRLPAWRLLTCLLTDSR